MKKFIIKRVKKAGIWLDFKNAYVFSITGFDKPVIEKIESGIESRVRLPGEKSQVTRFHNSVFDDQEMEQRRLHHEKVKYFSNILNRLTDADYIYVLGPGEAKEGLRSTIIKSKLLNGQLAACDTCGKLTLNQMRQKVLKFFKDEKFMLVKELFETLKK